MGPEVLILLIPLAFFAFPIVAIISGRVIESRHFRSLDEREERFRDIIVTQTKDCPLAAPGSPPPRMLVAEVVIGSDYLKTFLASIRQLVGGQVGSYQKMLTRARREAILRLQAQAREQGYNALANLRVQTADVGGGAVMNPKQASAMAPIMASATAYHIANGS